MCSGPRRDHIGKPRPSKNTSCPWETSVFMKNVKLSTSKSPLGFRWAPFSRKSDLFPLWQGLVLALTLKTCQYFGFVSQASGPILTCPLAYAKSLSGFFCPFWPRIASSHGENTCFLNIIYMFDTFSPPFFSASVFTLRSSILDFAQSSRASMLRRLYSSSTW